MHLRQAIQSKVNAWRQAGYPSLDYPAVAEILEYATIPQDDGGVQLRVLRAAQLRALETYWYLRMVEGTPHIFDLYQRCYPRTNDLLAALGLDVPTIKDFEDFISPTIVERLQIDSPLLKVRIPDWRSMLAICGLLDQTNRQRLASMQDWCILCLLD